MGPQATEPPRRKDGRHDRAARVTHTTLRIASDNRGEHAALREKGALAAALLLVALAAAFIWLRATSPSDGTRVKGGAGGWRADGVVVEPIGDRAHILRDGDRIIAVDGRSVASLPMSLLTWQEPQGEPRGRPAYTIIRDGRTLVVSPPPGPYPLGALLQEAWGPLLFMLTAFLVAGFVLARRPANPAARALFRWAASALGAVPWFFGIQVWDLADARLFSLYKIGTFGAYMLYWVAALHFALIFPQRHPLLRGRPWLIPALYVSPYALYAACAAALWPTSATVLEWLGRCVWVEDILAALYLLAGIGAMLWNWRASRDREAWLRARWVVAASLLSGGGALLLWVLPAALSEPTRVDTNLLGLIALPFPAALAVAILRHQLFDIDILINRALVYSLLTLALVTVYVSSVTAVQHLLDGLFRLRLSDAAVIVSTLGVAALFNPLRQRIQLLIDKRFYRQRYDAAQTLQAFGGRMRVATDLGTVQADLVDTVQETLQPAEVSLWLRQR